MGLAGVGVAVKSFRSWPSSAVGNKVVATPRTVYETFPLEGETCRSRFRRNQTNHRWATRYFHLPGMDTVPRDYNTWFMTSCNFRLPEEVMTASCVALWCHYYSSWWPLALLFLFLCRIMDTCLYLCMIVDTCLDICAWSMIMDTCLDTCAWYGYLFGYLCTIWILVWILVQDHGYLFGYLCMIMDTCMYMCAWSWILVWILVHDMDTCLDTCAGSWIGYLFCFFLNNFVSGSAFIGIYLIGSNCEQCPLVNTEAVDSLLPIVLGLRIIGDRYPGAVVNSLWKNVKLGLGRFWELNS